MNGKIQFVALLTLPACLLGAVAVVAQDSNSFRVWTDSTGKLGERRRTWNAGSR